MGTVVPEDILLLVFDFVAHPAPLSWPDAAYDDERAKAPFVLASVCQRWRTLAASAASLWTYFGFPAECHKLEPHILRLRVLMTRSRDAEVDVIGLWRDFPDIDPTGSKDIIITVVGIASRWRNVILKVPASLKPTLSGAFHQQWPCLRSLSLDFLDEVVKLPLAPLLTQLYLGFSGALDCSDALLDFMPNLTKLSINGDGSEDTNKFLLAFAQQLTDLCILEDVSLPPVQPILFPRLQSLTVDDVLYLEHIRAPALQQLTFNTMHLPRADVTQFASVRHLCLYGHVGGNLVSSLQWFTDIVQLSFNVSNHATRTWPRSDNYTIERDFFAAVSVRSSASNSTPVWPHLEHIHFGHPGIMGEYAIEDPNDLIDFVIHRNTVQELDNEPNGAENIRPARIQAVTVDFEGASEWLISELRRILPATKGAAGSSDS
ncbi:hypothetical protein BKA62DRAFT_759845 [Auriculariales sp. MPI-PUGE-AT-0066]|nr:hypothetical protein BKA62DRAFT_759845 [Auriculariales sp. MPI-PUGE-AT-0066]